MAEDWVILASQAITLLNDSRRYLIERLSRAAEPAIAWRTEELLGKVESWLDKTTAQRGLAEQQPVVLPQSKWRVLLATLEDTSAELGQLHETYPVDAVDKAFGKLNHLMTQLASAGPHGPGDPPPDSPPGFGTP